MPPISESQRVARIKAVHEHFRIENTHDLDAIMATFGTTCSFLANNELHEGHDAVRAFYGDCTLAKITHRRRFHYRCIGAKSP